MVIDTQKSIIDYIYGVLTADPSLKSTMGDTVRLALTWAKPDCEFPYLVHRLDISARPFYPECDATYYLDIWSDSPEADETMAIRKRIIELLDELEFTTDEAERARFTLQTDFFITQKEPGIWHYAFMFGLRYFRIAEIDAINSR